MIVKAHWVSINPFHPDISQLGYSKTVTVPDGTPLKELEDYAKESTQHGYKFSKLEVLEGEH